MTTTYAVILSCPPDLFCPGFMEKAKKHRWFSPTSMLLRYRIEIGRVEIAGADNVPPSEVFTLLYDAGTDLAWRYLGAYGPIGYEEAAEIIEGSLGDLVNITLLPVGNYITPNPHGLQPVDKSVACPKCGRPMVLKKGPHGKFYGCSKYPDCKGKRNFEE
jgi:hypothetical protein